MDIDGIALPHIVEHGLELGPVHTLAADFFGEPFLDAVLFERFDLAGFVLFFGADADVCNFHGSTSLTDTLLRFGACLLALFNFLLPLMQLLQNRRTGVFFDLLNGIFCFLAL